MWGFGENNEEDTWSLLAVVRECAMKTRTQTPTPQPDFEKPADFTFMVDNNPPLNYPSVYDTTSSFNELVEAYKPFLRQSPCPNNGGGLSSPNVGPAWGGYGGVAVQPDPNPPHQAGYQNQRPMGNVCPVGIHKKKRVEEKRVCKLKPEELSDDKWAWRKYGQKPIKGNPYPRNYYRCSSSKGCGARKLVEQNPADKETFLVTYTGQHYHARPTLPLRGGNTSRVTRQRDAMNFPEGNSDINPIPHVTPGPNHTGMDIPVANAGENDEDDMDDEVDLISEDPELWMGMESLKMMSTENEYQMDYDSGSGSSSGSGSGSGPDSLPMALTSGWDSNLWNNGFINKNFMF